MIWQLSREVGSGTRLLMERFLSKLASRHAIDVIEMGTNETIKQAVIAGMGISFLSAHTVSRELRARSLAILDVQGFPLMLNWFVVHRRHKRLPPVAQAFKQFLLSDGQRLIDQAVPVPALGLRRQAGRKPRTPR